MFPCSLDPVTDGISSAANASSYARQNLFSLVKQKAYFMEQRECNDPSALTFIFRYTLRRYTK